MIVTMITQEQISTLSLPEKISGRYSLMTGSSSSEAAEAVDIEGIQNKWVIHSSSSLSLMDEDGHEAASIPLGDGLLVINGKHRKTGSKVQLYVEPSTEERLIYKKYCVGASCRINIGRTKDNQIIFDSKYVSAHHAILIWKNNQWSITDTQSSNGTFVNSRRIATKQLKPGDVVYIMGLRIVVGNGFFAMNDPDGAITLSTPAVAELAQQTSNGKILEEEKTAMPESYRSSPRLYRSVESGHIVIDAPPPAHLPDEVPLALLLGPALTMGLTAVVMATVAVLNYMNGTANLLTTVPTLIMSFSMLCGTLLWPMLTKRSEKKKAKIAEKRRKDSYHEYLDQVRSDIFLLGEKQKKVLLANCPDINACEARVINREPTLWERTVGDSDFLSLRLGLGKVALDAEIKYPERRFSVVVDSLQNDVARIAIEPKEIPDAPIVCSLVREPLVGIVGSEKVTSEFLQTLIIQICALHSYQEVKLVFFVDEKQQAMWEQYRLLPHTKDEERGLRYFAVGADETKAISLHLEHIWAERKAHPDKNAAAPSAYYILIAAASDVAEKVPLFSKIGAQKENIGFCGITVADTVSNLPKECTSVINLSKSPASVYNRASKAEGITEFQPEFSDLSRVPEICNVLGNLIAYARADQYTLPKMITFLEMYHVGKTEHLNAPTRWKENSPVNSLQAPIGVGTDGSLLYLDLHEKAHGPHGLIAGMTGSGKSELVITYILSMAVNYHPDEVSFVLIDYKGGGLAGAFENDTRGIRLPHLSGTITNLDGAAVNRALISIQSELRRRQAIFNRAKKATGEGTMDIYKYQKLYRSGAVNEAVPHLFIVSDEFAELKAQQPEFMTQLISTARIGRSLGVHLILATQKPSGVVDDQIWSNSRFRVCLKVQERADSAEMLKRPDAAELQDTGRFYLQVGFNELFELGQSAWCGAPYAPSDSPQKKQVDGIEIIDHIGRVLLEVKPEVSGEMSGISQVVSVVEYLSTLAESENIAARQLWLPPIPALIYLDDLAKKYSRTVGEYELNPIIGEFDDPFNQSQGLLTIPFSKEGNVLIYGAVGSGKTTLLNTMLVDLFTHYDAEHLNVYIVDLGEETLRVFEGAPQTGNVLLSTDGEKINGLFKMLQKEIADRKKLFSESNGTYEGYCQNAETVIPQILVIIRNYAAFMEQFENLDASLIQITRECSKYGIYFLITANAANTIRYRVAQNFSSVYALQLNDTSDYVGIFGGTGGVYPSKIKGRGIFKKKQTYEFQTAHFAPDADKQALRVFVERLAANANGKYARRIPTLPARVLPSFFGENVKADALPVGVDKVTLNFSTLDLSKSIITLVLSQNKEELSDTVQGIVEQIAKLDGTLTVLDADGIVQESSDFSYHYLSTNFEGRVEELYAEMVRRNNTYKKAIAEGRDPEIYGQEYIVITGYQALCKSLTDERRVQLNVLMEKAELNYNVRFILCDNPRVLSGYTTQPWYTRHITGTEGLWVGDGITDQHLLNLSKIPSSLYSEVPPHFGYLVKRGKAILSKLIVGENSEEELEQ